MIHRTVDTLDDKGREDFQFSLLLGVAYGATIGGISTLVGTAPNAMFAAFMLDNYGTEIDFANWMLVGLPLSALMLPLAWLAMTRWIFKVDFVTSDEGRSALRRMKSDMGRISVPERRVAIVFAAMALTWIFRPALRNFDALAGLDDSLIAIAGAVLLFLLPSGDKKDPLLLRWKYAEQLPWGVLLPFWRRSDARERRHANRPRRLAWRQPARDRHTAADCPRHHCRHDDHFPDGADEQYRHNRDVPANRGCCRDQCRL